MNRKELRQMIREEVKTEVLRVLPELIGEVLNEVVSKQLRKPAKKERQVVKENKQKKTMTTLDRSKLAALLGYGDIEERRGNSAPISARTIAGVKVEGGLAAREMAAGQAHLRDYSAENVAEIPEEINENVVAGEAPPVPAELVAALGSRAKQVLEEAERKSNWRPGMK